LARLTRERGAPPVRLLPDVVRGRPALLLVGINPSLRSAEVGHHFAGKGTPFWRLLFASGLVPEELTCESDHRLPDFGIALTNLTARPTRTAAELTPAEIAEGRRVLERKMVLWRPRVVGFVGLSVYQSYFRKKHSGGAGAKDELIAGARLFVVPNPSGLNASFPGFADKLAWFAALAKFIGVGRSPPP
jgi:TDG/mug DNA glycosylase family protein